MYSDSLQEKLRGYRSLVAVENDAVKVHGILFGGLRRETDSAVLTTILDCLSSYPAAIKAASLADTDFVCNCAKSDFRNVRTAAVRALRSFPSMQVVTDALVECLGALKGKYTKEILEVIRSLSMHSAHDSSCRSVLADELNKLLQRRKKKWNKNRTNFVSKLLIACDQVSIQFDLNVSTKLGEIIEDFRTPAVVRYLALKFFGQTCPTDSTSVEHIIKEFRAPDPDRRLAAYRSADRFLRRCRARVQTVHSLINSLEKMKVELIQSWRRESRALYDKFDSAALREIRTCLLEIESTLNSYNEFSERIQANSIVSPP